MNKIKLLVAAVSAIFINSVVLAAYDPGTSPITPNYLDDATELEAYTDVQLEINSDSIGDYTTPFTWSASMQAMTRSASTWSDVESVGTAITPSSYVDDSAWSVALPFEFPFYGEIYTNIWVTSNGNIFFSNDSANSPLFSSEYSRSENNFKNTPMLSVGWCDTAVNSTNRIYKFAGEDFALIRFDLRNTSGNTVKAAAELNDDGKIVLRYSTDTTDGVNSSIAVGVSSGDGTDYVYNNYTSGELHGSAVQDIVFYTAYGLPDGMTVSSDGLLSGTPSLAGSYSFIVTMTDSASKTAMKVYSLLVKENPNRPLVISSQTPAATGTTVAHGSSQTFAVTATDPESGTLHYAWKLNGVDQSTDAASWTWATGFYDGGNFTVTCDVTDGLWTKTATWTVYVTRGLTWYVNGTTGDDSANTGYEESKPFKTIAKALENAIDGETILVAEGTYAEGYTETSGMKYPKLSVTDGRHLTIRATGDRDDTIIDAENETSCFWLNNGQSINTNVVVEGFRLIRGKASFLTGVSYLGGGSFGGWFKNCYIGSCYSPGYGGGASYAKLEDCVVGNCTATYGGAGLHNCEADRVSITGCSIVDALSSGRYGAGVYGSTCRNCLIANNEISSAVAQGYGAGAYGGKLYNCTIAGNQNLATTTACGAGVYYYNNTEVRNSIVYGNYTGSKLDELYGFDGQTWRYETSSTNDPSFVDAAHWDYTLNDDSSAIDAGTYRYASAGTDLNGYARLQGESIDLGCYECAPVLTFSAPNMYIPGGAAVTTENGQIAVSGGTSPYTYTYGTTGTDTNGGFVASVNVFSKVGTRDATLSSGSNYYTLPFAFPFGGETFTKVFVNRYGGLSFGESSSEQFKTSGAYWSAVTNGGYRAIIPLNGLISFEDDSMGVFVESASDSITFRWSGEDGDDLPVNFSCTLKSSGEIVFAYGDYSPEIMADYTTYGSGLREYRYCAGIAWADKTGINLTGELPEDSSLARTFTFRPAVIPESTELTLNSNGIITGTPTHYGEYLVKVMVTDANGAKASQWMPITVTTKYSVAFNANGATGDAMASWSDVAYDAVKTAPECTYTLAGSKFLGWTTNAAGGATVYKPGDTVSGLTDTANGTVTLYALWELNITTAELPTAVGGTAYNQTMSAVGGTSPYTWSWIVPVSDYNPVVRSANTFADVGTAQGWYADDQAWNYNLPFEFNFYGTKYTNVWVSSNGTIAFGDDNFKEYSASVATLKTHAMIAVAWADLESQGGSPIKIAADGTSVTFCWKVSDRNSGTVSASCTLGKNGSVTLKYGTSSFKAAGVGISAGDGSRYWYQSFDAGALVNVDDFTFAYPGLEAFVLNASSGVITDAAGDGSAMVAGDYPVAITVTSADDQTATSNYVLSVKTSYKVRFNAAGGAGTMSDQDCTWGTDATLSANAFTFDGSTFLGWATNENGAVVFADGGTVRDLDPHQGAIANLYAVWSVQVPAQTLPVAKGGEDYSATLVTKGASGTITWSLDEGSTMPSGLTLNANGTITGSPKKGGVFTFDAKASDAYGNSDVRTMTITNQTTYAIAFSGYSSGATGASGSMASEACTWGVPKTLPACGFTYSTYDFVGWATNYSGEAVFADGATVTNLTDVQGGSVTLYAKWHPGYYTLKFDVNASGVGAAVLPTPGMADRTITVGDYVTMPTLSEMPERLGYYYRGWSTTANGGVEYSSGSSYKLSQVRDTTLTLYAVWGTVDDYRTVKVSGNDWTFRCRGEETRLDKILITNDVTSVTIPATAIDGRPITHFGSQLLANATNVTELIFAPGLTGFATGSSEGSFQYSPALERVVFSDSVTNINKACFYSCPKLREVVLGSGIVDIGYQAFYGCSALASAEIPASVKHISGYAFFPVLKISFAGDVDTVDASAFGNTRRLRFAGAAPSWAVTNACNSYYLRHIQHSADASWNTYEMPWSKVSVYPLGTPIAGADGNTWYGREDGTTAALVDPATASGKVTVPDTFNGKPVTVLADAFLAGDETVSSIVIPASVTNVENYAFYRSLALKNIFITGTNLTVYSDSNVYKSAPIEHVYYLPQHAAKWAGKALFNVTMEPWPDSCKWTAKFSGNAADAEGAMADQLEPAGYEMPLTANGFIRPDKKFVRWETDETPSVSYANGATPSAHEAGATVTFNAVWQDAVMYTLKFDMNGGKTEATPSKVNLEVGATESVATMPTLADTDHDNYWKFLGWSTNRTATAADYAGGASYRDASAVQHQTNTFYAVWTEREDSTARYVPASDSYDANGARLMYHFKGDYAMVKSVVFNTDASGACVIPATLGGLPVERIALTGMVQTDLSAITSLFIPASVKSIGSNAFNGCDNLTNVTFETGSQLTAIESRGFFECAKLPKIELPESLTDLGDSAFYHCSSLAEAKLSSQYVGNSGTYGVFCECPIVKLEISATCKGFGYYGLSGTKAMRFLGDYPTWSVLSASQNAAKLFEFPATNTTWNGKTISGFSTATYKGFVGPIATMGAEKCYFWTNANETVNFAYAEDALAAEVTVPETVTWGGVTWKVTGFEKNAFTNQVTTSIRYPASWTEKMWGVEPAKLADGLTTARPAGDYCTVVFSGGDGSSGTMANFYVPTGYTAHLPANQFARVGYLFTKWQKLTTPTAEYADAAEYTGVAAGTTITLDAAWEFVGYYTIHFVGNSAQAENVPEDILPPVGTTPLLTDVPTREGWEFKGWTNSVNDHVYQQGDAFDENCAKDSSFTLYAKWATKWDYGPDGKDITYVDDNGSIWKYRRNGDGIYITDVQPNEALDVIGLPPPFKGATSVTEMSGFILPEKVNGIWWKYATLANNEAKLKNAVLSGPADIVMPSNIAGRTVTAFERVANGLVTNRSFITSIEIPGTVKTIDTSAFYNCHNLTNIVFHEGTETVSALAFYSTGLTAPIEFPETLTNVSAAAFNDVTSIPYDEDGYMFVDTGKTFLLRVRKDVDHAPEGAKTLGGQVFVNTYCTKITVPESATAYGSCLFQNTYSLREVVFKSPAPLTYNDMFMQTTSVTNFTLYGGEQEVGSFAASPSRITTVGFLTTPPSWNVTDKFPYATTVHYYPDYADEWEEYKSTHPDINFVEIPTWRIEKTFGHYLKLDLVADLELAIDADFAAGDKATVKIEGLAKGLKLVTTPVYVDPTASKKVIKDYTFTIEGVPTETVDFDLQPMYARITVTKGKVKTETLQTVHLSIVPATVLEFPSALLGVNYLATSVSDLWPEADSTWTFKGWPTGLKYTAKDILAKDKSVQTPALTVYGKPTKAGVYTITASHATLVGKTKYTETETATFTVWASDAEISFRYTDQAYVATATKTLTDITGVAGLPTGLKFNSKDGTISGTPTKPGVYAVTLTKSDKSKDTFLWKVTDGANDGFLGAIDWKTKDSTVTVMQGVIQSGWTITAPADAKLTASGLPAGLKLAQDKTTKAWTLTGTPTKNGNYVVTIKTVRNGITKTERIAIVVTANEWTGNWYSHQIDEGAKTLVGEVVASANGTVKLVYTEATTNQDAKGVIQSSVVKTTVTVKNLDANGTTATLILPRNAKDPASVARTCVVDFENRKVSVEGVAMLDLYEKSVSLANEVTTVVLEEISGSVTNAYAYLTATYNAKNASFAIAGKLWDGTAIKATTYALDDGNGLLSPIYFVDKAKNAVVISLWIDGTEVSAEVFENGEAIAVGPGGDDPMSGAYAVVDVKQKFNLLTTATTLVVDADDDVVLTIPEKSLATALSAQGLIKFTVVDAEGWSWVCELLPIENDGLEFHGIATGTKKGETTQYYPVSAK